MQDTARSVLTRCRYTVPLFILLLIFTACSGPDSRSTDETLLPDPAATSTTADVEEPTPSVPDPTQTEPTATTAEQPESTTATPAPTDTEEPAPPATATEPGATLEANEATATPPSGGTTFDPQAVTAGYEQVGAGFEQPVFVTHAGDGSGRVFVLEKVGAIRLLDGTMVLDIRDRVVQTGVFGYEHEQGMLGLAFHPRFEENGYFYVHYNDQAGDHVFARYTMLPDGTADRNSEFVLLTLPQPEVNFQGGMMVFGADGYLYMGIGTGGTAVELQHFAQDLNSLYGKILRIDVDTGDPYGIPPDNPFVGRDDARPEVWAYGLRNPWRFSFDRLTGDLYIGGPGQFTEEWIDYSPIGEAAGANFGWPMYEGGQCWEDWEGPCDPAGLRLPILTYPTYDFGNCVVIGGYVYRGTVSPLLQGAYYFGDFCSGRVWAGWQAASGEWQMEEMFQIPGLIGSFGEDEAGELYICDINNGLIYHIVGSAP